MRVDTLLLCGQLSRLHTEVWEAVCRCGSQHQRERRACDRGTFSLVQGAVGAQRRGTRKPEPLHRQPIDMRTDGEEISRKVNQPEPDYIACGCLSVFTEDNEQKTAAHFSQTRKQNVYSFLKVHQKD